MLPSALQNSLQIAGILSFYFLPLVDTAPAIECSLPPYTLSLVEDICVLERWHKSKLQRILVRAGACRELPCYL